MFAGVAVSIGLWILLQTLGMGAGLAAIDTNDAGNLRTVGIGTTVWSLIVPLISMFIGGIIAGRFAASRVSRAGSLHGFVMWAITSVLGVLTTIWIISMLAGGAMRVGGYAAHATGSAVSGMMNAAGNVDAGGAMSALGIDTNDLLAPVNQKLEQQGKPTVTADQLKAALSSAARRGLKEGRLDRQTLVQELAANTSLSPTDAEDLATQIQDRVGRVSNKLDEAKNQAQHYALQAAEATGKALLWSGLMLLLALFASVAGGAIGARRSDEDDRGTGVRTTEYPVVPPSTGSTIVTEP
ncbi:MAG: hypothetical protein JWO36_6425 [Myxococcales bacterium]|nr:hypothetical protein [Myxococcales bacterium]